MGEVPALFGGNLVGSFALLFRRLFGLRGGELDFQDVEVHLAELLAVGGGPVVRFVEAGDADEGALGQLVERKLAFVLAAQVGAHHAVDEQGGLADVADDGEPDDGGLTVLVEGLGVSDEAAGLDVAIVGLFHDFFILGFNLISGCNKEDEHQTVKDSRRKITAAAGNRSEDEFYREPKVVRQKNRLGGALPSSP